MKNITVKINDANKRIDSFIQKAFPNIPFSLIYKYLRTKKIKVNNKKVKPDYRLITEDLISLYVKDEFLKNSISECDFKNSPIDLDVVFEDDNVIIINKPPGLLVHPDKKFKVDSLINRIKNYLYQKGEYIPENELSFAPALVNRIDRNTSGLVIAAKNSASLKILNEKIKKREINKFYLCIVNGKLEKKSDVLKGYLEKNESQNKVYIKNFYQHQTSLKTILTSYKVIGELNNYSLLEVNLITGRTHQIRAHFSHIKHPILGDGKYGKNSLNKVLGYKYQALCSYKLVFNFKSSAGILDYLNKKEISIQKDKIWFVQNFYKNLNIN